VKALLSVLASLALVGAAAAAPGDPKKVILPSVQAQAKAINVQLTDLPGSGWNPQKSGSNGQTPRCSYYQPDQSDLTENGDADSPEFTLATGSFVSSSTSIFASAAQGRIAYARVVRPLLPRCLAEVFRKGTGRAAQVAIVSSAAVSFPKVAERTNAYRIAADFHVSATQTVRVTLDVVALNRGKLDAVVFFAGIGQRFDADFERSVVGKVAARAGKLG
jgi:hypothetical protein